MNKISDLVGKSLVAKVQLVRYRFPEHKKDIQPGKFCIVVCQLEEIIEGDIPSKFLKPDGSYEFICKGFCMPKMEHGQTYSMTANLINDIKWGYQYDVVDMHLDYNLETEEDQRKFFAFFLTDNQIDLLFQAYERPVELLACKRLADLKKVKGIGPVTALKMCQKYEECKNTGRAYVKLGDLGLTKNAIDRIVQCYGSVDLAVESVLANPYVLIKTVRGFGWEKADAIAQKQGFTVNCKERVQAFANYYLQEQADSNGNSCVSITDLLANVCSVCSPLDETTAGTYIKEITANEAQFSEYMLNHVVGHHEGNHPQFYYNIENRKIGLFWYRVVEKDIFYEFKRIKQAESRMHFDPQLCEAAIKECEAEQGFEYTDEQRQAINMILHENLSIITGSAGCVDGNTEFLSQDGWKNISEYKDGDTVVCGNPYDLTVIPNCKPLRYIKEPCNRFYYFHTEQLQQMLSEDHICILYHGHAGMSTKEASQCEIEEITCKELVERIRLSKTCVGQTIIFKESIGENENTAFAYVDYPTKENIDEIVSYDGYKYCFQVESHYFFIRKNGHISLIHNCGKSHTLKPLIKILQKSGLTVEQCALAGRASSLLSSVTGLEGKTIHRLLKYQAELERFLYGADKPIPADVIILDETSMVGEELLLNLISAVQTGSKFIMLGDIKQLPPLAVGNVFSDALQSGYIPTTVLTKIHRQAMRSGITAQAVHVSLGESIIKNNFTGSEVRGELQDFKITAADDATQVQYQVIQEFKRLYFDEKIPADNIQIIVPMRMRGETSCRALNEIVQDLVNPGREENTIEVTFIDNGMKFPVKFKPHDRIIINRNNYHAINADGDECAIFNGNLGHIKAITDDIMIITMDDSHEDIMLTKDDWYNINLAYAITTHKIQGSQAPYTIVGVDYSAYALLSRELIYTALTRATKYCSLVAQPKALNTAIHSSAVKTKITWLKEDLLNTLVQEQLKALE